MADTKDQLILSRIIAERFGGLQGVQVDLGAAPFVVIAGPNEAGKTTLAELVVWLIGGPHGNVEEAGRFGTPDDTLVGRLAGTFRGDGVELNGRFTPRRRLANGVGAVGELDVIIGTEVLAGDAWYSRVGIDHDVMAAIYRLWGGDLHEGGDPTAHLERVALSGVGGRKDPGAVLADLENRARLVTSSAAGSYTKVVNELVKPIDAQLAEARGNADAYLAKQQEIADRRAKVSELRRDREAFDREARAAQAVLDASEARRTADDARATLRELPVVSDAWQSVVTHDALLPSIEAAGRYEDEARSLAKRAQGILIEAGITGVDARDVRATDADVISVAELVTAFAEAARTEADCAETHETQHRALDAARSSFDASAATCSADERQIREARLSAEDGNALVLANSAWESATDEVIKRQSALDEAERSVADADRLLADQRATWESWELGKEPEAVLRGGMPAGDGDRSRGSRRATVLVAAVVVAALVAELATGAYIAAAVTFVVAVVVILLSFRGGSVAVHAPGDPDAVLRDGEAYRSARAALDAARRNRESRVEDLNRAREGADAAREALADAFSSRGLPVGTTPDECAAVIRHWQQARTALNVLDPAREAASSAATALTTAAEKAQDLRDAIAAAVEGVGLPIAGSPATAKDLMTAVCDASKVRRSGDEAEEQAQLARSAIARMTEPVATEIAGWNDERLIKEITRVVDLLGERSAAQDLLERAEQEMSRLFDDQPRAVELDGERLDAAALDARCRAAAKDRDDLTSEVDVVLEAIGGLTREAEALEHEERVADLRLALGAARETSEETLVDGAVAAFAASMLQTIRREYERDNQPEIVARAGAVLTAAVPEFGVPVVRRGDDGALVVEVERGATRIDVNRLSTGGRALLYLAFRIALADTDAAKRARRLPLICDDPVVHLDDRRARAAIRVLAEASKSGNQVLLFTCHERTVRAAESEGAKIVRLGSAGEPGESVG